MPPTRAAASPQSVLPYPSRTLVSDVLDELPSSAVRLLCRLDARCHGAHGHCREKAASLASWLGVGDRQLRRLMRRLANLGLVERVRRRMRWTERVVTDLGRAVLDELVGVGGGRGRSNVNLGKVGAHMSGQMSAHNGRADTENNSSHRGGPLAGSARPPRSVDPARYQRPRAAVRLSDRAWASVAAWLRTARSVSWARCKMTHRAFASMVVDVHRSREWRNFSRAMAARGRAVSAEELVRLAVEDAVRCRRGFGTVKSAVSYAGAVVVSCVHERRLPGEGSRHR